MPENHVTATAFTDIEMVMFGDVFQVAYPPISRVCSHFLYDFINFAHAYNILPVVSNCQGFGRSDRR